MYSRYMSGILLRRSNVVCETFIKNVSTFHPPSGKVHSKFKWCSRKMSMWLREQSIQVVRACTRQFEFIAAQRVRRSFQIFHLYTRIWDEVALREFMKAWRNRMGRNTKDFLIGAVGVTMYNWEQERIPDKEIYSYSQEIEGIHRLLDLTVMCSECNLRLIIDATRPGVEYCKCRTNKNAIQRAQQEGVEWEPYVERQDMLIWRKEEKDSGGLYAYKVYASYDDVSAEDFLQVQIDIDYRKKWDDSAKKLEVIDTDPTPEPSSNSCSDIIYWEMVWPRLFANRDYVYQRRWLHDKETGKIIIISKGVDHPNAPKRPDTFRVTKYWSFMVIKPHTNFHEPGIEFGLTYFDDPGVNIPTALTSWVAMSGLPDYLCRMRQATREYKSYKTSLQETEISMPSSVSTANSEGDDLTNISEEDTDDLSSNDDQTISNNQTEAKKDDVENEHPVKTKKTVEKCKDEKGREKVEESSETESSVPDEDGGFLDYIFLAKLFA